MKLLVFEDLEGVVKCLQTVEYNTIQCSTCQVDQVHDGGLLHLGPVLCLGDLVEGDGDHRVGPAARRVHVGRRYRPVFGAWIEVYYS